MNITIKDLWEYSPPPPGDPVHLEISTLRWNTWKYFKTSTGAPRGWVECQFDGLLGGYSSDWRIIGFTRSALERLGGAERDFQTPRERGTFNRSHLFPRRQLVKQLYDMDVETSLEDWTRWVWTADVTVVSLKQENRFLERLDYFREHTVTFQNPGNLFPNRFKNWVYGSDERAFLRGLVASTSG